LPGAFVSGRATSNGALVVSQCGAQVCLAMHLAAEQLDDQAVRQVVVAADPIGEACVLADDDVQLFEGIAEDLLDVAEAPWELEVG
jgi:hypothetical protein